MKFIAFVTALSSVLLASSAHADFQYYINYNGPGEKVSGTAVINKLYDPLFKVTYWGLGFNGEYNGLPFFTDVPLPPELGPSSLFGIFGYSQPAQGYIIAGVDPSSMNQPQTFNFSLSQGSFSVTAPEVPLPASLPLFMAGLFSLVGFANARRIKGLVPAGGSI